MILLFFAVWGPLALPKKDNIDPWRLAMLGIGSVRPGFIRPKSGSGPFALIIKKYLNEHNKYCN